MGSFVMSGVLTGLPLAALQDERILEATAPQLLLERRRSPSRTISIVGKGLDLLAGYMNAPVGMFRDQFADAMPFLLSVAVQNDPQLMAIVNKSGLFKQLTPVVRDFVANPGSSITVSLAPPSPVALQAITDAVENTPERVVEMLGLTITGEEEPRSGADRARAAACRARRHHAVGRADHPADRRRREAVAEAAAARAAA